MKPGDGSMAELCVIEEAAALALPSDVPDSLVAALGLSTLISVVEFRCFLERLPLLTIVAKDHQRHLLTCGQVQQFLCTGA